MALEIFAFLTFALPLAWLLSPIWDIFAPRMHLSQMLSDRYAPLPDTRSCTTHTCWPPGRWLHSFCQDQAQSKLELIFNNVAGNLILYLVLDLLAERWI